MARYTGPKCKKCRRSREKLFLKGARCFTAKCAIEKRNTPPGPPANMQRKLSEYGIRLREKQKLRFFYGVSENQMRNYFKSAIRSKGVTGHNLLFIFESRLDNVIYRSKLAKSRQEARQLIRHGFFTINDGVVDIPSILIKQGDKIGLNPLYKDKFQKNLQALEEITSPSWLNVNDKENVVQVLASPAREDISFPINEQYIVEYYSRMIN